MNPVSTARARSPTRSKRFVAGESDVVMEARGLTVTYRSRGTWLRAVRNVDLAVHRGEIVALVGQSGSGKSTLARTLVDLQQPDAGSIVRFRGTDLPRRGATAGVSQRRADGAARSLGCAQPEAQRVRVGRRRAACAALPRR